MPDAVKDVVKESLKDKAATAVEDAKPDVGKERACVVCGMGSSRTDWINTQGVGDDMLVACDHHTKEEMAKAIAAQPPKVSTGPVKPPVGAAKPPEGGEAKPPATQPPAPDQGLPGVGAPGEPQEPVATPTATAKPTD